MNVVPWARLQDGKDGGKASRTRSLGRYVRHPAGLGGAFSMLFQKQMDIFFLRIGGGPLQSFQARLFALLVVGGEVEARMNDDPFGVEAVRHVDVGAQVLIGGLAKEIAVFRHVHAGQGVKAQVDAVFFTLSLDRLATCVVEKLDGVGAAVELDIDEIHLVFSRPIDTVFQRRAAPDVDADAVLKATGHTIPLRGANRIAMLAVFLFLAYNLT